MAKAHEDLETLLASPIMDTAESVQSDAEAVDDVFVVGDVHGHLNRLEELLSREGLIGPCPECDGTGDKRWTPHTEDVFCETCDGTGLARINHDVKVVQLGDLGHFSNATMTADNLTWNFGTKWLDVILWGNHDRAVIDGCHAFQGYTHPLPNTREMMEAARKRGQLRLAYATHGFLLTHAGLHAEFKHNHVAEKIKTDEGAFANWANRLDKKDEVELKDEVDFRAMRDAIALKRGGMSRFGGILWRDASESLFPGYRQIFGHTSGPKIRTYQSKFVKDSYCIDTGDKENGRLAGMWLPSERIAKVKLNEVERRESELIPAV